MHLIKVYLSNGVIIDFQCEHYDITRSSTTGQVIGYTFESSTKSIPYLNKTSIIAITAEKTQS